ncbi:MAG: hypothetical protein GXP52_09545 [Deltaproteobacteria bacterium]|nr:hypothetical protein [Deltaproteobacteria bacterium]
MNYIPEALSLFAHDLLRMLPAFIIGVGAAALIKTYRWDLRLRAYMKNSGRATIPLAVFLGIFSPLCACGVLPVVIPLAVSGVPVAPLLALLATSPLMSPDAFTITWAGLGPSLAWAKLVSAIGMGTLVGSVAFLLEKHTDFLKDVIRLTPVQGSEDGNLSAYDIACANDIAIPTMVVKERENKALFFLDRAKDTSLFIGKFLLMAVAIEVLMEMFLPMEFVRVLAGRSDFSSLVMAAFFGVPLPAHQIPVVPVLRGLLDLGMDKGAAVTFLVAGPVTSIPALVVIWKIFHRRVFMTYLSLCIFGAIAAGEIYRLTI